MRRLGLRARGHVSKRDLAAQVATFDARLTALSGAIAAAYEAAGWAPPVALRPADRHGLRVVAAPEGRGDAAG